MKKNIKPEMFTSKMTATIKQAVNTALLHHHAVGNKIAYWDNGEIVIEIPDESIIREVKKSLIKSNNWASN